MLEVSFLLPLTASTALLESNLWINARPVLLFICWTSGVFCNPLNTNPFLEVRAPF